MTKQQEKEFKKMLDIAEGVGYKRGVMELCFKILQAIEMGNYVSISPQAVKSISDLLIK